MHRGSHIEESDGGEKQSPERIEPVQPDGWPEAYCHQQPSCCTEQSWNQMMTEQKSRRGKVRDGQADDGNKQKHSGVPQLIKGCARDHPSDRRERSIRPNTVRV